MNINIKNNRIGLAHFGAIMSAIMAIICIACFGGATTRALGDLPKVINAKTDVQLELSGAVVQRTNIKISIPNGQNIKNGDYIDLVGVNFNVSVLDSLRLKKDGVEIARVVRSKEAERNYDQSSLVMANKGMPSVESYIPEDLYNKYSSKIVFNSNAENKTDIELSLNSTNPWGIPPANANRDYDSRMELFVNGESVYGDVVRATGWKLMHDTPVMRMSTVIYENNGDINGRSYISAHLIHFGQDDIITFKFDENRGLRIDTEKYPARVGDELNIEASNKNYGDNSTNNGLLLRKEDCKIKIKVIESSNYSIKYKVINAAQNGRCSYDSFRSAPLEVVDLSLNVDGDKKFLPLIASVSVANSDGVVKYQSGNIRIPGDLRISSSTVLSALQAVPTKPVAPIDIDPLKDKPITPATEIKPKTEELEKVESPNTGFATPQTFLLPLFGILTATTYIFIRKK